MEVHCCQLFPFTDKWEFTNQNFKRGQMYLLPAIKRRKTQPLAAVKIAGDGWNSPSNSGGDDMGSTSTGSVELNTHCPDLSSENKKLIKENEKLSCELARERSSAASW